MRSNSRKVISHKDTYGEKGGNGPGSREGLIRQFAQGKAGWAELTMTQLEMG